MSIQVAILETAARPFERIEVAPVERHHPSCVLRIGWDATLHFNSPESLIGFCRRAIAGAEKLQADDGPTTGAAVRDAALAVATGRIDAGE